MIRKVKKSICMIVTVCMLFTGVSVMTGYEAEGASKPKAPRISSTYGITYANISWSKVKKNVKGYVLYRDGKAIKTLGSNVRSYKDKGLKPGTTYTYKVRAYNIVKKKQWYNKKTKEWQTKKPKKKYRGKSKKRKVKVYGAYSGSLRITMEKSTWTYAGRTVDISECPVTYEVESSKCPDCGEAGQIARVTCINDKWKGEILPGKDLSKPENCHHCKGTPIVGTCVRVVDGVEETRHFTNDGVLDINTGKVDTSEKYNDHKLGDEQCIGNGETIKHINRPEEKNWVYCYKCKNAKTRF